MPRSGKEARARLQAAALELYATHGYEGTTTAEIAAAANVNLRTFFRHFPDKREVLFGGEEHARSTLADDILGAPESLGPAEVLRRAFTRAAEAQQQDADAALARMNVIAATPALRERDLAKAAMLTETLASALQHRGVPAAVADLVAAMGWATYQHAAAAWIRDPDKNLPDHLDAAYDDLAAAVSTITPQSDR
ncbi:TetR family transcriptional regulator [Curtobacterium sp. MCPF17_047]|uniref:TetR/AcrR family transcriptional regulator n=1 Tax=unclassified Curtobacterium TaxID=257496 RepID=UPI000DAA925F|nr:MULTISPECIES: TetR family transcriptional regulator [unclassified Curtobacterium]PZE63036.1 TetR family transcriptional regulator [Curtobacterium sp. MCPF17_001]PZF68967.1 TetR family transcriptional regulator [Curtobacterium sp. MCPF17_047]